MFDVNDPGDLKFLNAVMSGRVSYCRGVDGVEVERVEFVYRGGEKGVYPRIHCPDSCPRDELSVRLRCNIEGFGFMDFPEGRVLGHFC